MTKMAHGLDHILGKQLVSSWEPAPRRKTEAELARMDPFERARYELDNPLTEQEKYDQLRRRMSDADYAAGGEVDEQDILLNHPPADWGT